jgi:hypothetical protein
MKIVVIPKIHFRSLIRSSTPLRAVGSSAVQVGFPNTLALRRGHTKQSRLISEFS